MEVKVYRGTGALRHVVEIGRHRIVSDAAVEAGGEDAGPEPHDLLASALGACMAITVTMYARRKGWDLRDIDVRIAHEHRDERYVFECRLSYTGALDDGQKARLTEIAGRCPVHRTLAGPIDIHTEMAET